MLTPQGSPLNLGTVYAIGRNYAAHAKELGNAVPDAPMFFLKASSTVAGPGSSIPLPTGASALHHEVELVALISRPLSRATPDQAADAIGGYAVGIDWTDRDLQSRLKTKGHPWAQAKSFRGAACLSHFAAPRLDPQAVMLELTVDDELRQRGSTADMIHSVYELLAYLSQNHDLQPGDVVFTGTPQGVGPVKPGQRVTARALGVAEASFELIP